MNIFPKENELMLDDGKNIVQSNIFGHRFKSNQSVEEYLLEFLQIVISEKKLYIDGKEVIITKDFFPLVDMNRLKKIEFFPKAKIDLKRFVFYSNSKDDDKTEIDDYSYREMIEFLEEKISCSNSFDEKEILKFIEKLLLGFSGVTKNRSWYAQSFMPICYNMILPETMFEKRKRKVLDKEFKQVLNAGLDISSLDYGKIDRDYSANNYNFMVRGGEVYYLHILRGLLRNTSNIGELTFLIKKQLNEYKEIDNLSNIIHNIWIQGIEDKYDNVLLDKEIKKSIGYIPLEFGERELYSVEEIINFLSSDMHPFEKIEILSKGIVFQIINLMHSEARFYSEKKTRQAWVVDMTYNLSKNKEIKKIACNSYDNLENDMIDAISKRIYEIGKDEIDDKDKGAKFKSATEDSYKLCRKLAKEIGVLVPIKGEGMRFTLQENILKFLVLSIIKPGEKLTLTTFIEKLYEHFGIIIGRNEYKRAMEENIVEAISDFSCFDENEEAMSEMLKLCGFLRDLSDATSIVENPYLNLK